MRHKLSSLVALSSVVTVIGFGIQLLVAFHFGTSQALDTYWVALALVTAFGFYAHPLRESLVSLIFRAAGSCIDDASEVLSAGIVILLILSMIATALLYLGIQTGALKNSASTETVFHQIMLGLLPFCLLFALSETFNAVLLSFDLAIHQAWARVLASLAALASIVFLGSSLGILVMVFSVLAGQIIMIIVCLITLRSRGLRWRFAGLQPLFDQRFISMFGALLLNYALAQSYILLERWTIGTFESGALSAYQYAAMFVNVLITLLVVPLSSLLWPRFLEFEAAGKRINMLSSAWQMGAPIMFILLALSAFTWHSASPVVSWLFERGSFDAISHRQTVAAMRMTILATIPIALLTLALRALMSQERSREVAFIGIFTAITGMCVLGLASVTKSLPLAQAHWAIANGFGAALAWYFLQQRLALMSQQVWNVLRSVVYSIPVIVLPLFVLPTIPHTSMSWLELTLRLAGLTTLYTCSVMALGLLLGVISWSGLTRALGIR